MSAITHFFTRLATRFTLIAGVSIAVVIIGGVVAVRSLHDVATSFSQYANKDAPRLVALIELNGYLATIQETIRASGEAQTGAALLIETAIADLDRAEQTYRSYRGFGASSEQSSALLADKETFLYALIAARDTYRAASTTDEVRAATTATLHDTYATFAGSVRDAYAAEQTMQALAAKTLREGTARTITSQFYVAVVSLVVMLVTMLFVYVLILQPLRDMRKTAQAVARGDADDLATVAREDELGDVAHSFNTMLSRLRAAQRAQEEDAAKVQETLTELARMDKTTSEERAQFEQLLTSMADAVVVLDASHTITLANEPARRFFGEHMVATSGDDICIRARANGEQNTCLTLFTEAFTYTEPKIFEREYAIVDTRGIAIPVSITLAAVRDRDDVVTGLIVTFRDVTELVRLEEARVSFLSSASHQLRTPLTSMRWSLEMLTDGSLGEIAGPQKEIVNDFTTSTLRMIELVNTLLQFSRVEARRVAVHPEPIELTELAREIVGTLTNECAEKSITIEVQANDIASVDADKQLVWQVLLNFLTNAIRYGNKQSVVQVNIDTQGDFFAVSVVNEGMGIPEAEKGRIFEKFYRATNAQRAVPNGNGIGLSFVKLLVEDWGGSVSFASEPNKTTTFTFTIPKKGMRARKGEVGLQV
ncbi:hypothetical protein A3C89_03935 [Candidatus Kaiserbacteria bacterium RIFCSPHIGHO2_02_FULL_50_50]|uniref:histidine kinase n=1 Tax=Candidatus Kaiserbacteria bacterium RIFCSPHIGHO2_02_FULL_50_50 TaxID=1798492 RepID=A0A1F6DF80_9BACT|nr:MAG: hypothetical protein A3C89_03935 [Candidatus Kaiserbacteria bacterium RIFCSPHIGHO2_02_FULL_50_50]